MDQVHCLSIYLDFSHSLHLNTIMISEKSFCIIVLSNIEVSGSLSVKSNGSQHRYTRLTSVLGYRAFPDWNCEGSAVIQEQFTSRALSLYLSKHQLPSVCHFVEFQASPLFCLNWEMPSHQLLLSLSSSKQLIS